MSAGIRLHRRRSYQADPPHTLRRGGVPVVRLEQAVVESWPLLPTLMRRAPAIVAVRERRTTPQRLIEVLDQQPKTGGAREQRGLYSLLAAGNQSELEIWGHHRIFNDRRLPRSVTQHRLQVGSRVVFLDRAYLEEMLAVELDGAAYHGSPGQRERDNRRDSAVAQLGWQTVRYSHQRLHNEAEAVIRELVEILATRREQLRASA
jgi:very-short-patch-repair endonuclease